MSDRKSRRIKSGAEAVFNIAGGGGTGYIPASASDPWLDGEGTTAEGHSLTYSPRKGIGFPDVSRR